MNHVAVVLIAVALLSAPLPEGDTGIASRHPGDAGIASDPAVLFHDDFEGASSVADLRLKWDAVYHDATTRIAQEPANVHAGARAVEFRVPQQGTELSNKIAKLLAPERDTVFLRYYSKFEAGFDQVGSSHNGGSISAHYHVNGQATPGVPANGTNKFLVDFENFRFDPAETSPGKLNVYVYWPEQATNYGDHFFPSGKVVPFSSTRSGAATFGPTFVGRPDIIPELDRWYCFEFMVQANTVGQRDGKIACWLDGRLIAEFPNLRFRDIDTLKIDRIGVGLHIGSNTIRENRKWYDDVVIATAYIGPMSSAASGGGGGGGGGCSASGRTGSLSAAFLGVALLLAARRFR